MLWVLVAFGGLPPAYAGTVSADLDRFDEQANDLASRTGALELDARPGMFLTETEAMSRFQDYLYQHMIGENQPAAEGFFALVTTGVLEKTGLQLDAEWYLAEALHALENYGAAARRYEAIVAESGHPFRADAVRRLLEVYASNGDRLAFEQLYRAEIASGRVTPNGHITYSLARSFYKQGDLASARAHFVKVMPSDEWYTRARYFLGTIAVREGDLEAARVHFAEVLEQPIRTADDRKVYDRALLALGRLSYHLGEYGAAAEIYNRIGADSPFQADKLYEMVWTCVRMERWHDAVTTAEVFLLAYPDHPYTGQLEILIGHLSFHDNDWQNAIQRYEAVVRDYAPVQARFQALAAPGSDAEGALRAVIERRPELAELPTYVMAMMQEDPDLSRAIDVFRALDFERREIEASEALIAQLRTFIDGSGAVGSFERHRADALLLIHRALAARVALLEVHERWLASLGDPGVEAQLGVFAARRMAAAERVDALGEQIRVATDELTAFERTLGSHHQEADNARAELARLGDLLYRLRGDLAAAKREGRDVSLVAAQMRQAEADLVAARARADDADRRMSAVRPPGSLDTIGMEEVSLLGEEVFALAVEVRFLRSPRPGELEGDRAQGIGQELENTFRRLVRVAADTFHSQDSEIPGIRARFETEVAAVAEQRVDYETTLDAARDVSLHLTRAGFGRLEDFFADAVMKADMGIVDAYWRQKVEADGELDRIRLEREAHLMHLEERFRLIRDKMGGAQ